MPAAAPKIQRAPESQDVQEGGDGYLFLQVTGMPVPEVTWLRGGKPVEESHHYLVRQVSEERTMESFLCLLEVTEDMAGDYEVMASNDLGTVTLQAELKVSGSEWRFFTRPVRALESDSCHDANFVVTSITWAPLIKTASFQIWGSPLWDKRPFDNFIFVTVSAVLVRRYRYIEIVPDRQWL